VAVVSKKAEAIVFGWEAGVIANDIRFLFAFGYNPGTVFLGPEQCGRMRILVHGHPVPCTKGIHSK
jgi:hypothetical protein